MKRPLVVLTAAIGLAVAQPLAPVLGRMAPPSAHGRASAPPIQARYLVLFVLDGGRDDYFGLTPLPHVDALRDRGVQYTNALDGILESETPSGHATLATGSTPRRDGILGFNWEQSDNDFSLFSPSKILSGVMERIMRASGAPTIAGLYKKRFPHARVVALSGHKYYAADPLGGPNADAIMYYQGNAKGQYAPVAVPGHVPPAKVLSAPGVVDRTTKLPLGEDDGLANRLAVATFRVLHQQITLINEPEFDWPLGHVDGGEIDRPAVIQLMKAFDRDLGMIEDAYRKAGILNQTLFVVTADHGMAPVKRFEDPAIITKAVAAAHTTAPSIAYNHAAYIWLRDPGKASAVASDIGAAHDPGVSSVYYLTGTGKSQHYVRTGNTYVGKDIEAANQFLLNTLMNGHQPNVVVLDRGDATWSSLNSHWKADHGGATWQSQHIPLILSGPGIRSAQVIKAPAQLDDVAPTILTDMGVTPSGMEGHVLTEALSRADPADAKARAAEIATLLPIVKALKGESAYWRSHPLSGKS
jgi:hypothetical protein